MMCQIFDFVEPLGGNFESCIKSKLFEESRRIIRAAGTIHTFAELPAGIFDTTQ